MVGPVVVGQAVLSPVLLIGQAPGAKEGAAGKPFAWTAGKTLFGWFRAIGMDEETFRQRVYMAAVCRCFPGKRPRGGDRVPTGEEIANCARWLLAEFRLLQPWLVIPVGRLAISQWLSFGALTDVIGNIHRARFDGTAVDIIPLPHPSGASPWHRTEPGRTLLAQAMGEISAHRAWQEIT